MNWISRVNRHAGQFLVFGVPIELLGFNYNAYLSDNVPHRHTYFEVCLVGSHGSGIFTAHNRPHDIGPGNVFYARPGVVHQIQNSESEGMELFWVSFAWPLGEKRPAPASEISTALESLANASHLVTPHSAIVSGTWNTLRTVAETPEIPGKDFQIQALIQALLLAIAQAGAGDALPSPAALPHGNENLGAKLALRFVHDNLAGSLGVEDIAAQIAVSPRHLNRLFHDFTGVSPASYVETARVDRAKHLLVHTEKSIKEIAAAVGYMDHHHFSRVFARRTGLAPTKYRETGGLPPVIRHPGDLV